jgi:probable rRNA maturation factor
MDAVEPQATGPVVTAVDDRDDGADADSDEPPVDVDRWRSLATTVVGDEPIGAMQVNLVFVSAARIAELKREHLDGDGSPTDVLAFPIDEPDPAASPLDHLILGDVVISPAVAAVQAADHAGSYDDEVALLVVHGLLHLLGMDHAEPAERVAMQARERELLDRHHGPLAGDPWSAPLLSEEPVGEERS